MGCAAIGQRGESTAWSSSGVFSIPEWHRSGTESSFCWNLRNRPKHGLFSLVVIKKALSLFLSRNTFPPLGLTLLIKNKIQKELAGQFDSLFPLSIRDFATLSFCMKCPLSKSLPKTLFYTTKCPAQPTCHEVSSLIASPHSFQIRLFSLVTLYCSCLCSYIFPFLNPLPRKWSGLGPCLMTLSEFYFALLLLKLSYGNMEKVPNCICPWR